MDEVFETIGDTSSSSSPWGRRRAAIGASSWGDTTGSTLACARSHATGAQRDWNDEAARKQLVKFFEAWGPKDELTIQGRRKLSSILFS